MKKYLSLVLWIAGFEVIAALIGMAQKSDIYNWYQNLNAPPLTPPNVLFPIVWTTLYAMLGVVGWRLSRDAAMRKIFGVFCVYMLMNWAWSFIFFIAHWMLAGFIWIMLMNVLTVTLIGALHRRGDKISAILLVPLLLWTSFAAYLNGGYWLLN